MSESKQEEEIPKEQELEINQEGEEEEEEEKKKHVGEEEEKLIMMKKPQEEEEKKESEEKEETVECIENENEEKEDLKEVEPKQEDQEKLEEKEIEKEENEQDEKKEETIECIEKQNEAEEELKEAEPKISMKQEDKEKLKEIETEQMEDDQHASNEYKKEQEEPVKEKCEKKQEKVETTEDHQEYENDEKQKGEEHKKERTQQETQQEQEQEEKNVKIDIDDAQAFFSSPTPRASSSPSFPSADNKEEQNETKFLPSATSAAAAAAGEGDYYSGEEGREKEKEEEKSVKIRVVHSEIDDNNNNIGNSNESGKQQFYLPQQQQQQQQQDQHDQQFLPQHQSIGEGKEEEEEEEAKKMLDWYQPRIPLACWCCEDSPLEKQKKKQELGPDGEEQHASPFIFTSGHHRNMLSPTLYFFSFFCVGLLLFLFVLLLLISDVSDNKNKHAVSGSIAVALHMLSMMCALPLATLPRGGYSQSSASHRLFVCGIGFLFPVTSISILFSQFGDKDSYFYMMDDPIKPVGIILYVGFSIQLLLILRCLIFFHLCSGDRRHDHQADQAASYFQYATAVASQPRRFNSLAEYRDAKSKTSDSPNVMYKSASWCFKKVNSVMMIPVPSLNLNSVFTVFDEGWALKNLPLEIPPGVDENSPVPAQLLAACGLTLGSTILFHAMISIRFSKILHGSLFFFILVLPALLIYSSSFVNIWVAKRALLLIRRGKAKSVLSSSAYEVVTSIKGSFYAAEQFAAIQASVCLIAFLLALGVGIYLSQLNFKSSFLGLFGVGKPLFVLYMIGLSTMLISYFLLGTCAARATTVTNVTVVSFMSPLMHVLTLCTGVTHGINRVITAFIELILCFPFAFSPILPGAFFRFDSAFLSFWSVVACDNAVNNPVLLNCVAIFVAQTELKKCIKDPKYFSRMKNIKNKTKTSTAAPEEEEEEEEKGSQGRRNGPEKKEQQQKEEGEEDESNSEKMRRNKNENSTGIFVPTSLGETYFPFPTGGGNNNQSEDEKEKSLLVHNNNNNNNNNNDFGHDTASLATVEDIGDYRVQNHATLRSLCKLHIFRAYLNSKQQQQLDDDDHHHDSSNADSYSPPELRLFSLPFASGTSSSSSPKTSSPSILNDKPTTLTFEVRSALAPFTSRSETFDAAAARNKRRHSDLCEFLISGSKKISLISLDSSSSSSSSSGSATDSTIAQKCLTALTFSTRARRRWHLWFLLIKFPQLRKYRKHALRRTSLANFSSNNRNKNRFKNSDVITVGVVDSSSPSLSSDYHTF